MELASPLQVNFLIGGNCIASSASWIVMNKTNIEPSITWDEMALDNVSCEQNAELFDAFGFTSRLASWNTTRCSCCYNRAPSLLVLLSNTATNNFWAKRQTCLDQGTCSAMIRSSSAAFWRRSQILGQRTSFSKSCKCESMPREDLVCIHFTEHDNSCNSCNANPKCQTTNKCFQLDCNTCTTLLTVNTHFPSPMACKFNRIFANTHLDSSAWLLTAGKFLWDASFGDKTL